MFIITRMSVFVLIIIIFVITASPVMAGLNKTDITDFGNGLGESDVIKMNSGISLDLHMTTIDIAAPTDIAGWNLGSVGENTYTPTGDSRLYVSTDGIWGITVKDTMDTYSIVKPDGTEGKMTETDGISSYVTDGRSLTNALVIDATASNGYSVTLDSTEKALYASMTAESNYYDLSFKQTTVIGDAVLHDGHVYRIVVTFTASAT